MAVEQCPKRRNKYNSLTACLVGVFSSLTMKLYYIPRQDQCNYLFYRPPSHFSQFQKHISVTGHNRVMQPFIFKGGGSIRVRFGPHETSNFKQLCYDGMKIMIHVQMLHITFFFYLTLASFFTSGMFKCTLAKMKADFGEI